jgi:hypothetical protein
LRGNGQEIFVESRANTRRIDFDRQREPFEQLWFATINEDFAGKCRHVQAVGNGGLQAGHDADTLAVFFYA